MTNTVRWLKSWLPLFVWMGLIFTASTDSGSAGHTSGFIEPLLRWLMPGLSHDSIDSIHFLIRKCAHITEYAVLGALTLRAIAPYRSVSFAQKRWRLAGAALALAALYAASDEYHQSFVPSRGASVEDVLIDTCGACLGIGIVLLWRKRHDKKESLRNLLGSTPRSP
jgi:VanZ family protein